MKKQELKRKLINLIQNNIITRNNDIEPYDIFITTQENTYNFTNVQLNLPEFAKEKIKLTVLNVDKFNKKQLKQLIKHFRSNCITTFKLKTDRELIIQTIIDNFDADNPIILSFLNSLNCNAIEETGDVTLVCVSDADLRKLSDVLLFIPVNRFKHLQVLMSDKYFDKLIDIVEYNDIKSVDFLSDIQVQQIYAYLVE